MPAERVIGQRVLAPLGLRDTHTAYAPDAPWRSRMNSTYAWDAEAGGFERYWDPSRPQHARFFRGAGGLYSTVADYPRFASAWLNGGALGDVRLLPAALAREALELHADRSSANGYGYGYGYQWTVSKARADGMPRPVEKRLELCGDQAVETALLRLPPAIRPRRSTAVAHTDRWRGTVVRLRISPTDFVQAGTPRVAALPLRAERCFWASVLQRLSRVVPTNFISVQDPRGLPEPRARRHPGLPGVRR